METKKPHGLRYRQSLQKFMTKQRRGLFHSEFNENKFELVKVEIEIDHLPPKFEGYKIINLSDIHLGQYIIPEDLNGIVKFVNRQKPDVITLTGDYVSYILDCYEKFLEYSFKNLEAKDKKFAVLGNHDHWLGADRIRTILKKADIIDLSNTVYTIDKSSENDFEVLHFAGVDSIMIGKNDFNKVMDEIHDDGPAILLAHEPDFANISATSGRFDLQISGHSHGGQFIIPKMNTTLFRGSHSRKYPVGKYKIKNMIQYTSKGIGTNVFWFRINCKPEITMFTLKASKKKKVKIDFS